MWSVHRRGDRLEDAPGKVGGPGVKRWADQEHIGKGDRTWRQKKFTGICLVFATSGF